MNKDLGIEVEINQFEDVNVYLGRKPRNRQQKKEDYDFDQLCRFLKPSNHSVDPVVIGEIVGVYWAPKDKWVRGRVEFVSKRISCTEYRVFFIDDGLHAVVQKSYLVKVKNFGNSPPQSIRFGLYGLLPTSKVASKDHRSFLTELIGKGPIFFKEQVNWKDISFGEIFIKSNDGNIINLGSELLKKNVVKRATNFLEDAKEFFHFEESENDKKKDVSRLENSPCDEIVQEQSDKLTLEKNKLETSFHQIKDTGFSSSDSYNSDEDPPIYENALLLPVGYHYQSGKKPKNRSSRKENKIPRTYYQTLFDRKRKQRRNKSMEGSNDRRKQATKHSAPPQEKEYSLNYPDLEQNLDCRQSVFSHKHVTFGNDDYFQLDGPITETRENKKSSRVFNLDSKSDNILKSESTVLNEACPSKTNIQHTGHISIDKSIKPLSSELEDKIHETSKFMTENTQKSNKNSNVNSSDDSLKSVNSGSSNTTSSLSSTDFSSLSKVQRYRLEFKKQMAIKEKINKCLNISDDKSNLKQADLQLETSSNTDDNNKKDLNSSKISIKVENSVSNISASSYNTSSFCSANSSSNSEWKSANTSFESSDNSKTTQSLSKLERAKLKLREIYGIPSNSNSLDSQSSEGKKNHYNQENLKKASEKESHILKKTTNLSVQSNQLGTTAQIDEGHCNTMKEVADSSKNQKCVQSVGIKSCITHQPDSSNVNARETENVSATSFQSSLSFMSEKSSNSEWHSANSSRASSISNISTQSLPKFSSSQNKSKLSGVRECYRQQEESTCNTSFEKNEEINVSSSNLSEISEGSHDSYSKSIEMHQKLNERMGATQEQIARHKTNSGPEFISGSSHGLIQFMKRATGVLLHQSDDNIIPPITRVEESMLDVSILKA